MMNHKFYRFLWSALMAFFLMPALLSAQEKKEITFKDIWEQKQFEVKDVPGFNALKNGTEYSRLDEKNASQEINIYRLSNGKKLKTVFERPDSMDAIDHYNFSDDEQKLLLFTHKQPIYRRSALYNVWVYDLKTKKLQALNKEKVLHATFNPQATKVAFVQDNNLFIYDLASGYLTKVTTDGLKNHIINGNCDWVYEEEFEFTRALQWSPDGQYLAYYRFDESRVKDYTIFFYDDSTNYPRAYTYKYPKAGEASSIVTIHIYDLEKEKSHAAKTGENTDQYIPRIQWAPEGGKLCIYRLNRHQNKLELLLENAATGVSKVIFTEDNKYYIDINNNLTANNNLTFLPDGHSLVINSERSGYNHLYRWDWQSQKLTQLTHGEWDVDKLVAVDKKNGWVYYTADVESPMERKLYRVDLNGEHGSCLSLGEGFHEITPCVGNRYFLDKYSRLNQVPVFRLIDAKGHIVRVLEDNKELENTLDHYDISPVTFLKIPNAQGVMLNAWMIKPPHFDPAKKYPVLMYQYSGPGYQEVEDKFPVANYAWHQMMAEKGYIIVCADGTGTGGRGWEFQNKTYLNLGKYESDDQIAVAKYLGQQSYVDKSRIGIWGWSFGGFISATCILKGADVFKAAVAVAPVTNWRFYDNIYTERYMRQPKENEKGYDDNAPEKMAARLKGKFLVIHGLADDNVHFQNSAVLVKNLIKANKQFDSEFYPNKNHSIYGGVTREQLFRRITAFIEQNL
jgi:dipeptidyl-peptidase-4